MPAVIAKMTSSFKTPFAGHLHGLEANDNDQAGFLQRMHSQCSWYED